MHLSLITASKQTTRGAGWSAAQPRDAAVAAYATLGPGAGTSVIASRSGLPNRGERDHAVVCSDPEARRAPRGFLLLQEVDDLGDARDCDHTKINAEVDLR